MIPLSDRPDNEATFVCAHILETLRDGVPRGFHWRCDDDGDYTALCSNCQELPRDQDGAMTDDSFKASNPKLIALSEFRRAGDLNSETIV